MLVLGVTGGIGSGKSTVSHLFRQKGAYVFDADSVAKRLINTNEALQRELVDEFMDDILDEENRIIKSKLAEIGFSSKANQEMLNEIIHPYVVRENDRQIREIRSQDNAELYIVDAPLLFEASMHLNCDYTFLVYAKLRVRLNRALERGTLSKEEILRRIDLQMPEEEKMALADFILENNGTVEALRKQVDEIYNTLRS